MFSPFTDLWHYREAIRTMVARDLKVRYSNSVLGIVWSFINPLLMTVVYTLVFTYLIPSNIANFPVFVLAGLLPWNFHISSVLGGAQSVTGNGHLITRVYFPRTILPVAMVLSNGVNFLIALVLLFGAALVFHTPLTWQVVWLPLILVLQLGLALGLALAFAAINVYFRDTQQLLDLLMLAWFFLTPIVYSVEAIQAVDLRHWLLVLNPMAALITAYRALLYAGQAPDWPLLAVTTVEIGVLLAVGLGIFQRLSPAFAEEL